MLELLAIWALVIGSFIWFVRDERRLKAERIEARAIHFATAPAYRYAPVETMVPAPVPQPNRGLSVAQRKYLQTMLEKRG